jgi:hypothetical protein
LFVEYHTLPFAESAPSIAMPNSAPLSGSVTLSTWPDGLAKSTSADTPVRLSYTDYETLKKVYRRDGEKIVYAVQAYYYGSSGNEPITMAYGTREARVRIPDGRRAGMR